MLFDKASEVKYLFQDSDCSDVNANITRVLKSLGIKLFVLYMHVFSSVSIIRGAALGHEHCLRIHLSNNASFFIPAISHNKEVGYNFL